MPRAFVIGNAAWDEALHLAALPAPGASVHARPGASGLGGKGANQAVALARAGVETALVAAIGRDARGEAVAAALAAEGLEGGLVRLAEVATDRSAVLVTEAGENAVVTTREAARALGPERIEAAMAGASPGDLCVLQGNLAPDATAAAVAIARRGGLVVALNPSPVGAGLEALLGAVEVLFVNRDEAASLTGAQGADAARRLLERGARRVVLTLGPEGALIAGGGAVEVVPAVPARAVDPTAAGDALMAAALAHAAPRGWLPDAAALAAGVRAAALTVGRAGAVAALPTRAEMAAIIGARRASR